jgi:CHAP domain
MFSLRRTWIFACGGLCALTLALGALTALSTTPAGAATLSPGEGSGTSWCPQYGGTNLGSYDNIYACYGPSASPTPFNLGAGGFQCTELANRYLYNFTGDTEDDNSYNGDHLTGGNFVSSAAAEYSIPTSSSGGSTLPAPGDIISMWGGSSGETTPDGDNTHVAIVIHVTATSITTLNQNDVSDNTNSQAPHYGLNTISVSGSSWSFNNGFFTSFQWLDFDWAQDKVKSPGPDSSLNSVSCTLASQCEAVGSSAVGSYSEPLAEERSGSAWTTQALPAADGQLEGWLNGISCVMNNCETVGDYSNGSETFTLGYGWNGSTWSLQSTPSPGSSGSTNAVLNAVSCISSNRCFAVGYYYPVANYAKALVESWNGSSWYAKTIPTPTGDVGAEATSISCSSNVSCVVVGDGELGSTNGEGGGAFCFGCGTPLTASFNGTTWALTPNISNPSISSTSDIGLTSVSCATSSLCVALANDYTGSPTWNIYAETWNGTSWTGDEIPEDNDLGGVTCVASGACIAVGTVGQGAGSPGATALWGGSTWTPLVTPSTSGYNQFNSVSCVAEFACTTVGVGISSSGVHYALAETN